MTARRDVLNVALSHSHDAVYATTLRRDQLLSHRTVSRLGWLRVCVPMLRTIVCQRVEETCDDVFACSHPGPSMDTLKIRTGVAITTFYVLCSVCTFSVMCTSQALWSLRYFAEITDASPYTRTVLHFSTTVSTAALRSISFHQERDNVERKC